MSLRYSCHSVLACPPVPGVGRRDTESDVVIPNSFRDPSNKMLNQVQHDDIIDSRFRGDDKERRKNENLS